MNENLLVMLVIGVGLLQAISLYVALKQHQPKQRRAAVVLDTCALIDGRVKELISTGFIEAQLLIPQRVIDELQYLADHGDAYKRSRARFGLDVVQEIQAIASTDVVILHDNFDRTMETDTALIAIAEKHHAQLYTTDYNLNKVARIKGVNVLNVNELAHALRPVRLPGEIIEVKIIQKGAANSQGVGYLEDGTMVVVENTARRIGQKVTARVDRMLQTEAGKMMFAKLQASNNADTLERTNNTPNTPQTPAAPVKQKQIKQQQTSAAQNSEAHVKHSQDVKKIVQPSRQARKKKPQHQAQSQRRALSSADR